MERVERQVALTQQVLSTTGSEWNDIANALDELAHVVETLGPQELLSDVARLLLSISSELSVQITGFRSKLVGLVCTHIKRIVVVLQRDGRELANVLLPALARTAKGASNAVRTPGAQLFTVMTECTQYDLTLFRKLFAQSQHDKIRVLMLEQVAVALNRWPRHEIEPHYSDVVDIVKRGLQDPAQSVRSAARDVLCAVAELWEDRAAALVDMLTQPTRDVLLKDKPQSAIARAVLTKFPDLARRVPKTAASSSNKTLAKQRALLRKSGAALTAAAAPTADAVVATPSQASLTSIRDSADLPSENQVDASTSSLPATTTTRPRLRMRSDSDDSNVSASAAAMTAAPEAAASRQQLLGDHVVAIDNANSSRDISNRDSASEQPPLTPPRPSVSGIPRLSPIKRAASSPAPSPAASSAAATTSHQQVSLVSSPAPPVSVTRTSDAVRRSPSDAMTEGSKIPLPSSLLHSPIPRTFGSLSDRHMYDASLSTTSRTSPPSNILRRAGSVTDATISATRSPRPSLQRRASAFASPPPPTSQDAFRAAGHESLATVPSAPDDFLDSPIPSSAPLPSPLRADSNVTVRARRNVVARAIGNAFLPQAEPATATADSAFAVDATIGTTGRPVDSSFDVAVTSDHTEHEVPARVKDNADVGLNDSADASADSNGAAIDAHSSEAVPSATTNYERDDTRPSVYRHPAATIFSARATDRERQRSASLLSDSTAVASPHAQPSLFADVPHAPTSFTWRLDRADVAPDASYSTTDEPNPPTLALGSAIFEPRTSHELRANDDDDDDWRVHDTTIPDAAAVAATAVGVTDSTTWNAATDASVREHRDVDRTDGGAVNDVSRREAAAMMAPAPAEQYNVDDVDMDTATTTTTLRTDRDDKTRAEHDTVDVDAVGDESDSLTRDALVNLIGIQKTMKTLQALSKVDVRGLPFKPRSNERPAAARPQSAEWMRVPVPSSERRATTTAASHDNWIRGNPVVSGNPVVCERPSVEAETSAVSAPLSSRNTAAVVSNDVNVDARAPTARDYDTQRYEPPPRALRPRSARRRVDEAPRSASVPVDQQFATALPTTAPRLGVQLSSAEIERERVEQQFQGLVRASAASTSAHQSNTLQSRARESSSDATAMWHVPTGSSAHTAHRNMDVTRDGSASTLLEQPIDTLADDHDHVADTRHERLRDTRPFASASSSSTTRRRRAQQHRSIAGHTSSPWVATYIGYACLLLAFAYGAAGLLRAVTTVRASHDYHEALKSRISAFEASIAESYSAVRQLEERYTVWGDYVRMLADEDESHALSLLNALQLEVAQWQRDLERDLALYKQSLAVDVVDAALAPLLLNATQSD